MGKKDFLIITLFATLFLCVGYLKFGQKSEPVIIKVENREAPVSSGKTIIKKTDHFEAGFNCGQVENFDCLIRESALAIQEDPSDAMAYNNRAYGYLRTGDLKKAEIDLEKVLNLQPNHAFALNNRGLLRIKQKKFDLAIEDINQAEKNDSSIPEIYLNKALVLAGKAQYNEAMQEFDKAIEMNSDLAVLYEERGKIYRLLKEKRKAEEDFSMAEKIRRAYKN